MSKGFVPRRDGWSLHAYHLSLVQANGGHDVTVIQPFAPTPGVPFAVRAAARPLVRWIGTKAFVSAFAAQAALLLAREHRRRPFDLAHVHGDAIEAGLVGGVARRLAIPTVLTVHAGTNRRPLYRSVARRLLRLVDRFIAVSEEVGDDLRRLGVAADRVSVISSGTPLAEIDAARAEDRKRLRDELGLAQDVTYATLVGRLHPLKGIPVLLDAARQVADLGDLHLLVIGDGEERATLVRSARDAANVTFVGGLPHAAVLRYLHASDLFVLPSVDLPGQSEGTPTAVIEAMAMGLPVIVTDSGGARRLVEDGVSGRVVPQRDPVALARAVRELAADPELRRAMGRRNAERARAKDWRAVAAEVETVYREALADRRRR